ncbi:MAG: sigma-70 family RNA polymerase sigma factor [Acidobacteriaceae bacterium]|nr:sigma-70 family RNA polymerase sigma factor [Acidobacteriaceae bacterium]MBV9781704.1 sigma-70 family RNA polymerase sigma factor [Acidobacteriaceae bacterium]
MELPERFVQGDIDAFETLFRQFQNDIYAWIIRIVRDTGIAEELTVETFWRIYQARSRFNPEKPFGAWARRIATNLAIDHLRNRRSDQELFENAAQTDRHDPVLENETRDQIKRAFLRLPPKLRAAATLALIEEKSYSEIAAALGTAAGTIRTRVFRATRILRKQLARLGVTP